MSDKTEFVVATKKRYPITAGGKVDKSQSAKTLRKDVVISRSFVEDANKNDTKKNGVFFEINEAATKKYYEESEKVLEDRKAQVDLNSALDAAKIKDLSETVLKKTIDK